MVPIFTFKAFMLPTVYVREFSGPFLSDLEYTGLVYSENFVTGNLEADLLSLDFFWGQTFRGLTFYRCTVQRDVALWPATKKHRQRFVTIITWVTIMLFSCLWHNAFAVVHKKNSRISVLQVEYRLIYYGENVHWCRPQNNVRQQKSHLLSVTLF